MEFNPRYGQNFMRGEYVKYPRETNLVLNTPFSVFRTIGKTKIQKVNYFESDEKLASVFSPIHQVKDTAAFRADNVVVILLESFSKEFIGAFNKRQTQLQWIHTIPRFFPTNTSFGSHPADLINCYSKIVLGRV